MQVEPQAIEQPLDLSIPENKMMLAIYLTSGEVENDRRALNVTDGMRRAKKEGRWMGTAPLGYINVTSENGKKSIVPHPKKSIVMKRVFNALADGLYNTEQIWKRFGAGLELFKEYLLECHQTSCLLRQNLGSCHQTGKWQFLLGSALTVDLGSTLLQSPVCSR